MAKNSKSIKSQQKKQDNRICEKIFRAVTSPVKTVRRMSTKPAETSSHVAKPITKILPKKTVITRVDTTIKTDERFADYIKKAKLKIRAMTNSGDIISETSDIESREHHHHHQVHHHVPILHERSSDQFSEYIKKAKMKLISSSTIARANPTYDSFND